MATINCFFLCPLFPFLAAMKGPDIADWKPQQGLQFILWKRPWIKGDMQLHISEKTPQGLFVKWKQYAGLHFKSVRAHRPRLSNNAALKSSGIKYFKILSGFRNLTKIARHAQLSVELIEWLQVHLAVLSFKTGGWIKCIPTAKNENLFS